MSSRKLTGTWQFKRHSAFEKEMQAAATKWFSMKGLSTHPKYSYSLESFDKWPQNIICSDVAEYIQKENEQSRGKVYFPLHKYLHHGLSSQAMAFNLVGPLIVRKDFEPLREVMEQARIPWPKGEVSAEFEYDDKTVFNEDTGQPTSIDLVISGESAKLFVEIKFRETEFGSCGIFGKGDCDGRNPNVYGLDHCFLHHIGRKFWVLMNELGFGKTTFASGPICPFTIYYQFFRELLFSLKKEGCFILLHDERNPAFLKTSKTDNELGLWPFLMESVPPEHMDRIGRVTTQQIVSAIEKTERHQDWIDDFKLKYGFKILGE